MSLTIIKGTILSAPTLGQLDALPGGYLVAEDGLIRGVYGSLPEQYAGAPVEDWGDALILQSFADRDTVLQPGLHPCSREELEGFAALVRPYVDEVSLRGLE